MTRPARRGMHVTPLGTVLLLLALGAVTVWAVTRAVQSGIGPLPDPTGCVAEVGGHRVELDLEQGENAALISAIAIERGLHPRAVSIALATAFQESKLYNLDYGDRDSLGLFQQRPSQGWGTAAQVRDRRFAINSFYDALMAVGDYETMDITVAAQAVQRSAYPDAYADHEQDARALASALTGNSKRAFWCQTSDDVYEAGDTLLDTGLVRRAQRVREDLEETWGTLSLGGFAPGGISTGHMSGSAHYEGRAIDIFVRPINAESKKRGWAIASYLVANAQRLRIATLIFDDRIWHAGDGSEDGWTDYNVPSSSGGDRKILEHRDHVHVDVLD